MPVIYRFYRNNGPLEQCHGTLIDALEQAASDSKSGDTCPGDIVSETGEVILNQRNLLLPYPSLSEKP